MRDRGHVRGKQSRGSVQMESVTEVQVQTVTSRQGRVGHEHRLAFQSWKNPERKIQPFAAPSSSPTADRSSMGYIRPVSVCTFCGSFSFLSAGLTYRWLIDLTPKLGRQVRLSKTARTAPAAWPHPRAWRLRLDLGVARRFK